MALNSSGPISLGGSTVGQSINLELGQAATALASINATNFRTLAGVASGQIALSNFYGKSSATAYILYLGASVVNNDSYVAIGYGWQVNNLGISAFKMGSYSKIVYINATGTALIATKDYATSFPTTTQFTFPGLQNKWSSGTDYFAASQANYAGQLYSSSNSYADSIIRRSYSGNNAYEIYSATGNPDGTVTFSGTNDQGKYGWKPVFWKVSPAGPTFLVGKRSNSNYNSGPTIYSKLLRKTDGTYVNVGDNGGGYPQFYNLTADLLDNAGAVELYTGVTSGGGFVIDSSNNMYYYTINGKIYKFNSTLTPINSYQYNAINPAWNSSSQSSAWGMDIYNDIIYIASTGGPGLTMGLSLTITAITASTMAVLWMKRWTFQGANGYLSPISRNYLGTGIQARPTGLYVAFQAFNIPSSVGGYIYTMNLPLDGNIANQTVTIGGSSQQVIISTPTTTVTTTSFSVGGIAAPGSADMGGSLNANASSGNATALGTLTKTAY